MKPKIVIDSISLLSPLTGIGRYTYEVSKELKLKENFDIEFFYGYYSQSLVEPSMKSELKNFKSLIVKNQLIKKFVRRLIFLFSKILAQKYDLYWQPNFVPNSGIKADRVVTSVHDFSFILHRDFHPKERVEYLEKYFFKNIIRSNIIITGSEFSKQEILQRLDFRSEQVRVVYHGIDHNLFKVYNEIEVDFELPKRFIFCVGSIEPRKNLIGLLKAYNSLDRKTKREYKLLLAGFKGWENKEIIELIEQNREDISYLGFVSDIELAKVYNLASLFVFPSFYEGFGLPVLEAMACGTPVVCSDTTSIPEVGGDAVVYCNPYDVDDIKEKIKMVLNNKKLQQTMVAKGLVRVREFTWKKSAREHTKIFEEVLKS